MAPKTNKQLADTLSYPDEGFYEEPEAEPTDEGEEGWSDEPVAKA